MKKIIVTLEDRSPTIEIRTFADEHIGDPNCDIDRLKDRIAYVRDTPNAYAICDGDLCDMATRTSLGDIYATTFSPMEQIARVVELFEPIKDKILCITHGNHEDRAYRKEGINVTKIMAAQLGLSERYSEASVVLFLRVGSGAQRHDDRKLCYVFFITHGSGGGRKEGAKAIRLADMASIVDADIYIHAHTHLPMIMRQSYFRTVPNSSALFPVDRLFVNVAANLDYGGYGEAKEYKPNSKESPVIYLSANRKKEMTARL